MHEREGLPVASLKAFQTRASGPVGLHSIFATPPFGDHTWLEIATSRTASFTRIFKYIDGY